MRMWREAVRCNLLAASVLACGGSRKRGMPPPAGAGKQLDEAMQIYVPMRAVISYSSRGVWSSCLHGRMLQATWVPAGLACCFSAPVLARAGVAHKVNFRDGPASEHLDTILVDETNLGAFGFAFVDADKGSYGGCCGWSASAACSPTTTRSGAAPSPRPTTCRSRQRPGARRAWIQRPGVGAAAAPLRLREA